MLFPKRKTTGRQIWPPPGRPKVLLHHCICGVISSRFVTQAANLLQVVSENSHVMIVDVLENSMLHCDTVHTSTPTGCCPRTGHYSHLGRRHQIGLRSVKPAHKFTSVSVSCW